MIKRKKKQIIKVDKHWNRIDYFKYIETVHKKQVDFF